MTVSLEERYFDDENHLEDQENPFGKRTRDGGVDALSLYLKEIKKYRRLTREEEIELSKRALQGDEEAQETLFLHNLPLVVTIAKSFYARSGGTIPLLDLISVGNNGLRHATRKYDWSYNTPFGAYANRWIRQYLLKYTVEDGRALKIPPSHSSTVHRVIRVSSVLMQKLGREATAEEIAAETGYRLDRVKEVLALLQPSLELDAAAGPDTSSKELNTYFGESMADAEEREDDSIRRIDLERAAQRLLSVLTEREAKVLILHFGLNGYEPHDLKDIAPILGVSRERVRQIKVAAIQKIQNSEVAKELSAFFGAGAE